MYRSQRMSFSFDYGINFLRKSMRPVSLASSPITSHVSQIGMQKFTAETM